jgi:putative transposase
MSTPSNPYRGFRYPAEIINQAVWLYHCFSLSLREVELILAARGIVVSYETIREWSLRFGRAYAKTLKRRRPQPGDKWFLDEVFVRIRGKLHYLWRAGLSEISCGAITMIMRETSHGTPQGTPHSRPPARSAPGRG